MKMYGVGTIILAVMLSAAACGGPSQEDIEAIRAQQQRILEKLAKLEEGQKAILAARPAAPTRRPAEDFNKVYQIPVGQSPIRGNPNAAVTIVEFSDFQCPYCSGAQPLLRQVLDKYGESVRIVYKHFPLSFHPAAKPSAIASIAAQEQGRFWALHDVLFENIRTLSADKMTEYAEQAGLDVERFQKDLEANKSAYEKRVAAEYAEGLRADVRGTPTIFINGKKLRVRSLAGMSQTIDAALVATEGS